MNTDLQSLLCCTIPQTPKTPFSFNTDLLGPSLSGSDDNWTVEKTSSSTIINTQPSSYCSEEDPLDNGGLEEKKNLQRNKNKLYQRRYNKNLREIRKSQQEQIVLLQDENKTLNTKLSLQREQNGPHVKDLHVSIDSLHRKIDTLLTISYANHSRYFYHI